MATRKSYAYQVKGRQLSILQNQYQYGTGQGYVYTEGSPGSTELDAVGPTGKPAWISPDEAVSDGIEIEYTYSPVYRINDSSVTVSCTSYDEDGNGLLKILDSGSALPTAGSHLIIKDSNAFNGVHEISSFGAGAYIILKTKYSGVTVTGGFTVYTDVSYMQDESFELDLAHYQSQALVYYIKARLAEDMMDIEKKEYFMREFNRMVEKYESSKSSGPKRVMGFGMTR